MTIDAAGGAWRMAEMDPARYGDERGEHRRSSTRARRRGGPDQHGVDGTSTARPGENDD